MLKVADFLLELMQAIKPHMHLSISEDEALPTYSARYFISGLIKQQAGIESA